MTADDAIIALHGKESDTALYIRDERYRSDIQIAAYDRTIERIKAERSTIMKDRMKAAAVLLLPSPSNMSSALSLLLY